MARVGIPQPPDEADSSEARGADPRVARIKSIIKQYERDFADWLKDCDRINKRYRKEKSATLPETVAGPVDSHFNVLWANVQTMKPAYYARAPKPQIDRRFRDRNPMVRNAAEIGERIASFLAQGRDFDKTMKSCRMDVLMPARAQAWVRYEPTFDDKNPLVPESGEKGTPEYQAAVPAIADEQVVLDYVLWKDFGHEVKRSWKEVTKAWRKVHMGKAEVVRRFGADMAQRLSFASGPKNGSRKTPEDATSVNCTCVYEIWCKSSRKVYWLSETYQDAFLGEMDDFLRLKNFFPCPEPIYADRTNDSLIPIPIFKQYAQLADDLDLLVARHAEMVDAVRVTGVYDAAQQDVGRVFDPRRAQNMRLIPAKNWAQLKQVGGLNGALDLIDVTPYAQAIPILEQAIASKKAQIEEMIGIPDIIRGYSAPSETATAQQIKGNFAVSRLDEPRKDFERFASDCLALMTECALEHLSDETIYQIASVDQLGEEMTATFPQALALLRDDKLRTYKLTIETDSMRAVDEAQEQESRMRAIETIGQFFERSQGMVMQNPKLAELAGKILEFVVSSFKVGPQLELAVENAFQEMAQAAAQSGPPSDPGAAAAQADAQLKQQELELRRQEAMSREQIEQTKMQKDWELEIERLTEEFALRRLEVVERLNIEREKLGLAAAKSARSSRVEAAELGGVA